jgi:S1-C subfamily serine protease
VRIVAMRPGSPIAALGLRPGDRLASINGYELTSTERIVEAYARLLGAPRLALGIVRDGRPLQIDYEIR